jgi:DNA invertase Pin-like site-specific DNA recombinase
MTDLLVVISPYTSTKGGPKEGEEMQTNPNHEGSDQDKPSQRRAAIYLCIDGTEEIEPLDNVPSIDQQREICRRTAAAVPAEIVGEFVDRQLVSPSRPGLRGVLELADTAKLDFVIVVSLDRLTCEVNEAFDIAMRLCLSGTCVMPASMEYTFPWTAASLSRR